MSGLQVVLVKIRQQLKEFIYLPEKIHTGHRQWLPPLYLDEWSYFNADKNPAYRDARVRLFLAYRDHLPRARVMAIIPDRYNALHGLKTIRFAHLDSFEDQEAVHALLHTVEIWGYENGMNELVGPFGFSDKDPEGLLVDGFAHAPILVTPSNLPYLPPMIEAFGLTKKLDALDYLIDLQHNIPAHYEALFQRLMKQSAYRLFEPESKRTLRPYIGKVFELMNTAYRDLYGFMPMTTGEIADLVRRYLPLLDVRFVKIVLSSEDDLKGFMVALPHLTPGFQASRGRLLPFGWYHLWRASRTATQLDLMLGAVAEDVRGKGLDLMLGWAMIQSARQAGIKTMETHLVLETNHAMRAEYERLGAQLHKRFRIYHKAIIP